MRSVLIIAPHFAPETHAAVFRAHKLAKYFPEHGWKPYVLTVDTNYQYNEDPGLVTELPDEVEIIRVRYVEPTVRGLRTARGEQGLSFRELKPALDEAKPRDNSAPSPEPGLPRRFASWLYAQGRTHVLNSPDAYWTWRRPAVRTGREVIQRHKIDVVLSTAMPYTAHQVGRALHQAGPKWVADFRDPIGYARKMTSSVNRVRSHQQAIVLDTLRHADVVTTTSSCYALIYSDLFGDTTRHPIEFIPTGIDDVLLPRAVPAVAEPRYLLYVGEVMADQSVDALAILGAALRQDPHRHRLTVVGNVMTNRQRLAPFISQYGLKDRVSFIDHVPQADVYRLLAGARAGLLVPGRNAYWWNLHAKLVDYIGMRIPVVAMVPDPSEARSVLQRTGLGIFLDGDAQSATRMLAGFLAGTVPRHEPDTDECNRYLASRQVKSFVEILDALV